MTTRNRLTARILLCSLAALGAAQAASAQCDGEWLGGDPYPGANNNVTVVTTWDSDGPGGADPKVLFGGSFSAIGNAAMGNFIAAWNAATNEWFDFGIGTGGPVYSATTMENGNLVVGGSFLTAGGVSALRVARWDGKAWHAMGAGFNVGVVYALTKMPNGDIIAGGNFTRSGTTNCTRIARWDGTSWQPLGSGITLPAFNSFVSALTVLDGDLIVGGIFTHAGGNPAPNLARWDGATWSGVGGGTNGWVKALTVMPDGTTLAVGGRFQHVGGSTPAEGIALWDGATWTSLDSGVDGGGTSNGVNGITVRADGSLAVTGTFTTAGGVAAPGIAIWDGSTWSGLGSGLSGVGDQSVIIPGTDDLAVGGDFSQAGGVDSPNAARWTGSEWTSLNGGRVGFGSTVRALAVLGTGELVAGGQFDAYDGVALNSTARWTGLSWEPLGVGFDDGDVNVMTQSGDTLYAGGTFSMSGEEYVRSIAEWTEVSDEWFRVGTLPDANGSVTALATAPNGDVIAGGNFTLLDGQSLPRIARWNGTSWSALGEGLTSRPNAIAVLPNGHVVTGAGSARLWDGSTWTSLGATTGGSIESLMAMPNGDVIAGGLFSSINGVPAKRIARWNGSTWSALDTGFEQGSVKSLLLLPGGDILAGGDFIYAGATLVNYVARWDGAAWNPVGLGANGTVFTMALLPSGEVALGGSFLSAGGLGAAYFTRWSPTGLVAVMTQPAPPQILDPGQTVEISAAASPGYKDVSIQWRRDGLAITDGLGGASVGGGTVSGAAAALPSPTDGTPVTLTITGAQSSDTGSYDVVFINACGEVISDSVPVVIGEPECPADFNNDGTVNSTDVSDFVNQWFQDQIDETLLTDWDNNGVINSTDVSDFINAWFEDTAVGCGG